MNSKFASSLVSLAVMSLFIGCHSNNAVQSQPSDPWQNAERIVARIKPPVFPPHCTVKTAKYGIHITKRYGAGVTKDGDTDTAVRNIDIRNSKFGTLTKGAIFVQGFSSDKIVTDVRIENCDFQPMKNSVTITNAARVEIVNCRGL